jgi:PhnB protein
VVGQPQVMWCCVAAMAYIPCWRGSVRRGGEGTAPPLRLAGRSPPDHIGRPDNVQTRCVRRYALLMSITPHIVVQGAESAVAFYRDAFGAEEVSRIPVPDGRLMSVQLRIADGMLHLADEFPEMGVLAPPSIGGTPVVLALDVADAEAVFAQAVTAGAAIRQPLADMFWGDRHGQLEDPFGHRWNIAQHLRDVSHDEVVAAAARAFT